jgi:hypothetical protein
VADTPFGGIFAQALALHLGARSQSRKPLRWLLAECCVTGVKRVIVLGFETKELRCKLNFSLGCAHQAVYQKSPRYAIGGAVLQNFAALSDQDLFSA